MEHWFELIDAVWRLYSSVNQPIIAHIMACRQTIIRTNYALVHLKMNLKIPSAKYWPFYPGLTTLKRDINDLCCNIYNTCPNISIHLGSAITLPVFFQPLIIYAPLLAIKVAIWRANCEFKLWFMISLSHFSPICNITPYDTGLYPLQTPHNSPVRVGYDLYIGSSMFKRRQGHARVQSLRARFVGSTWGPSGATGLRWAPCWPHELFHLGYHTTAYWLYTGFAFCCVSCWIRISRFYQHRKELFHCHCGNFTIVPVPVRLLG